MVVTDAGGTILAANPAYCTLHGFAPSELIGRSLSLIVPETQRAFAISQYRAVFESLEPDESHPTVARWRDGATRVVESRIDLLMQGNRREAMMSSVRTIRAAPPVGTPHPTDSYAETETAAHVLVGAIHDWGIDAVLGVSGDGGIRTAPSDGDLMELIHAHDAESADQPERESGLDTWEDDGGATNSQPDRASGVAPDRGRSG